MKKYEKGPAIRRLTSMHPKHYYGFKVHQSGSCALLVRHSIGNFGIRYHRPTVSRLHCSATKLVGLRTHIRGASKSRSSYRDTKSSVQSPSSGNRYFHMV